MSLQILARGGFLVPLSLLAIPLLVGCNERVESAPPEGTRNDRIVAAPEPGQAAPREIAPAGSSVQPPAAGSDARLYVGWGKPRVALVITGEQHGYIEPCGCTGLVNQKGGLNRRHTLVKELQDRGWNVVPLDLGNQVRRTGRQSEIKFQMTIEGLKRIGYQAIGFGPDDLQLSVLELVALAAPTDDQSSVFVSANATILDPTLTRQYQIIAAADTKIGVTSIVHSDSTTLGGGEISLRDPAEALREVVPKLQAEQCDLYVLLAHASLEKSRELAEQFPLFQVIATAGGMGDPTYEAERVGPSDAMLIQVGIKGMHVGVVGLFDDPQQPLRYQRVPLDSRFPDSSDMLQLLASYQEQLQQLGLEGLGLRPIPYPTGRSFSGSESCKECHSYEYDVWEKSLHSHALESLVHPGERSEVPRHYDPECLSCHVVGWNAQQHYPYASGYLDLKTTPKMQHVGCETCHGPGAEHVAAESGEQKLTAQQIDELRLAVRLPLDQAERKCLECHDLDNSPDFQKEGAFEKYWKEIEH